MQISKITSNYNQKNNSINNVTNQPSFQKIIIGDGVWDNLVDIFTNSKSMHEIGKKYNVFVEQHFNSSLMDSPLTLYITKLKPIKNTKPPKNILIRIFKALFKSETEGKTYEMKLYRDEDTTLKEKLLKLNVEKIETFINKEKMKVVKAKEDATTRRNNLAKLNKQS